MRRCESWAGEKLEMPKLRTLGRRVMACQVCVMGIGSVMGFFMWGWGNVHRCSREWFCHLWGRKRRASA